jgi:hypothetical protein
VLRVFLPGIGGFVLIALWIYCIFDVIASEESLIRNLPKTMWLLIVFFIPDVGSIAWLLLGRPAFAGWRPGDTSTRPVRQYRGPEDDDRWSATRTPPPTSTADEDRLKAWEDDLARRERELRGDKDDPETGDGGFDFRW